MKIKRLVLLYFLGRLFLPDQCLAQQKDWGVWLDAEANKKIKNTVLALTSEFYTKDKSVDIERISVGTRAAYSPTPYAKGELGYLLMNYNILKKSELRNRIFSSISFQYEIRKLEIACRERIQFTRKFDPETINRNSWDWRNQFKFKYEKKILGGMPLATVELFHPIGEKESPFLDEYRYSLGLNYPALLLYGMWIDTLQTDFFAMGITFELRL